MTFKRIVVLESPYAGNVEENLRYLRAGMREAFLRGELPIASHALYTQPGVLDDTIPEERNLGIEAGFEVARVLHLAKALEEAAGLNVQIPETIRMMLYDLGISSGMKRGFEHARAIGQRVVDQNVVSWRK
jgi:hypothetical protein